MIMLLKNPNTLNYPILSWNIAKFFQIVFRYFKHLDRLYFSFHFAQENMKNTTLKSKMLKAKLQRSSVLPKSKSVFHKNS